MGIFYPQLDLYGISLGIVLNQSCDLVKTDKREPKVPFLSIAFLEPFEKELKYIKNKALEQTIISIPYNNENFSFVHKEKLLNATSELFSKIIKNEHPWIYFIHIKAKNVTNCYFINLTKIFPLRIEHYETLLRREKYQLRSPHEQKLGWKIAELYGRVGIPELTPNETKHLTDQLFEETIKYVTTKAFIVTQDEYKILTEIKNQKPSSDPQKKKNKIKRMNVF